MRVRSILLGRYGSYENRHVEFGPGLTVVVGPNEAGKSTLLDALTDVLWGYPRPVRHAYLVATSRLDLTATITPNENDSSDDEATDEVVTIHRTPKTLSEPALEWAVVNQDPRRTWRQGFGLTHAELRRGGQVLCEGGGDLAEFVFAARSGDDVRSILSDLVEEAERLYKPHKGAKSVEIRAAIGRADQAEAQLRQQMATAADVAAIEDHIHRTETSRSIAMADHAAAAEAAQLARQQASAFPHAVELAQLRAELAHLYAQAAVPGQLQLDALTSATTTFDQAHRDLAELKTMLEARQVERRALEIDTAVLADAATITTLGQQREARAQDRNRLALLDDEIEAHRHSALTALDDLTGTDFRPIPDRLRDVHVPSDRAAALDELGTELTRAEATDERLNTTHIEALRRVREVAGSFEPIDLDAANRAVELRRAITTNDSPIALHEAATTARTTADDNLRRALASVRDLTGPVEADHLTPASIAQPPAAAHMTDLRDRLRAATSTAQSAARDHTKAIERLQQAQHARDDIQNGAPFPSPDLLHRARAQRDRCIEAMLTALREGDTQTLMSATVGLVRGSMSADRIADDLIAGADRLAELARHEADVRAADRGVTITERAVDAARREHRFAHTQWATLWAASGAPIPHPDAAESVQRALRDAHRARADLLQADLRRDELASEVTDVGEQLRGVLAAAGHPRPTADLPALLAAVDDAENIVNRAREHRARLTELRNQARGAGEAADAARQDREEAAARWRFSLAAAGLPSDLTPAQWATRRSTIATIRQAHATAERLKQEAAGIRTVLTDFDALLAEQAAGSVG